MGVVPVTAAVPVPTYAHATGYHAGGEKPIKHYILSYALAVLQADGSPEKPDAGTTQPKASPESHTFELGHVPFL